MSIILRALKKIQNQEAEQAPPEEQPKESPGRADAISSRNDDFAFGPGPEETFAPASSPAAGELVKSSNITRVLLLIITVLGLLSTTWFASEIYKNFKSPKPAGTPQQIVRAEAKPPPVPATPKQAPVEKAAPSASAVPAPQAAVSPRTGPAAQQPPVQGQSAQMALPAAEPQAQTQPPVPAEPATAGGGSFEAPRQELSTPAPEPAVKEPVTISMASLTAQRPAHVRDSFAKEVEPQPLQRPDLKINAIAWRALEPKAIVNMQRVYVGDMIEGAKVKEIRRKSIVFEFAGEEFEIRF